MTQLKVFAAARCGDLDAVQHLLKKNSKALERKTRDGFTPLAIAAMWGKIPVVGYLLQIGADINATDLNGISVLQAAIMGSGVKSTHRVPLVEILLRAGANPNHISNDGHSVSDTAVGYRRSLKIQELLTQYGGQPTVITDTKRDRLKNKG